MLNDKAKKIIRTELRKHFGTSNMLAIKKLLKSKAVNEYGGFFYEVKIGGGISVAYTSNTNHFASYFVKLQGVGLTSTLALTKKDITKQGKIRGCGSYFVF